MATDILKGYPIILVLCSQNLYPISTQGKGLIRNLLPVCICGLSVLHLLTFRVYLL